MLQLIDALNHDLAGIRAAPARCGYLCLRIEVAALQLAQLLEATKYPAPNLQAFVEEALAEVAKQYRED